MKYNLTSYEEYNDILIEFMNTITTKKEFEFKEDYYLYMSDLYHELITLEQKICDEMMIEHGFTITHTFAIADIEKNKVYLFETFDEAEEKANKMSSKAQYRNIKIYSAETIGSIIPIYDDNNSLL